MENIWEEIDEHLSFIHSNLGICCQEYCDASNATWHLEQVMEKLVTIRQNGKI